jgi:plasmid stabilization system protein ParE
VKVVVTGRAVDRLAAIEDHVSRDNPVAAAALTSQFVERMRVLEQYPAIGRVVPEIRCAEVREIIVRGYRIVYRLRGEVVEIVTVFEGHRLLRPEELEE